MNPPYRYSHNLRKLGFTLLELLATITVLTVLMILVFLGYRQVTGTAQGVKNLANHRTIVRGLLAYSQEHKGSLPYTTDYDPPFESTVYSIWPKTLCILGYVSDGSVFFSPRFWPRWENKESTLTVIHNPKNYPNAIVPWGYPNYAANRYGAMPNSQGDGRKPANLLQVAGEGNLSKLMLIRDSYYEAYDTPSVRRGGGIYWFSNDSTIPKMEDCYSGIVHASFADGHVEGIQREDMIKMMQSGKEAPIFKDVYTIE